MYPTSTPMMPPTRISEKPYGKPPQLACRSWLWTAPSHRTVWSLTSRLRLFYNRRQPPVKGDCRLFFIGIMWRCAQGWTRFSAEKPRRLRQSTGLSLRAAFRVRYRPPKSPHRRCSYASRLITDSICIFATGEN